MNKEINIDKIKFSEVCSQDLILAVDRLTRFKYPETKYFRVFSDLICKYLIEPKLSKKEIELLSTTTLKEITEKIWNSSVSKYTPEPIDECLNSAVMQETLNTFYIDEDTLSLVNSKLNINGVLKLLKEEKNLPVNLRWLLKITEHPDLLSARENYSLRFPLEKVVLCEGITEEILLPQFAKLCGYDFDKNGVKLIGAGGKNKVAKLYCELKKELKLPIFVLLDFDANETKSIIEGMLRCQDKIYLIKNGEFEDIFSLNLIKRTINKRYKNICECKKIDFKNTMKMSKTLSEFFRVHELGDFQKSEFAKELAMNLRYKTDLTPEVNEIIAEIKNL